MCRNSSLGFLVATKLGMKIPEKQRGGKIERVRNVMGYACDHGLVHRNEERSCSSRLDVHIKATVYFRAREERQRLSSLSLPSPAPAHFFILDLHAFFYHLPASGETPRGLLIPSTGCALCQTLTVLPAPRRPVFQF